MNIIGGTGRSAILLDNANAAFDEILAALAKGRTFAANMNPGGSVGNISVAELNNPLGSGKTLYLFAGDVSVGTANNLDVRIDNTTVVPATAPIPMQAGGPASVALVGTGNPAANSGSLVLRTPSSTAAYNLPPWFWAAIPPNHRISVQTTGTNLSMLANLRWIELST